MLKKILTQILPVVLILAAVVTVPATVLAQTPRDDICEGVGLTSGTSGCATPSGSPSINSIVETIINVLSIVVGVVAVIMIIIGGLKYITSSGDSNSVNSAKNTILYAIVGLVVVALAQVIVRFVLNRIN